MKIAIVLAFCFIAQTAQANYSVAKPLKSSDGCSNLLYTISAEKVQDHPMLGVPATLFLSQEKKEIRFDYQGWNRSWDSIVTVYTSEANERIHFDDACFDDGKTVPCLNFQGCSYYANFY